jgi:hypothetical protein
MREIIFADWDDYDLREGRKTHAEQTVLIGRDGKWRELDLSEENVARLNAVLAPWWEAGRTPEKEVGKGPLDRSRPERESPEPAADRSNGARPTSRRHGTPERRAYLLGLRQWADANGFTYTTKPTDANAHGSYYYPKTLADAYAEYLRQQELLGQAANQAEAGRQDQEAG